MHSFAANPLVVFRPHLKHKRSGEEYLALADSDLQDPPPRPQPLDLTYRAEQHDSPTDESSATQAAPRPTSDQDRLHEAIVGLRDLVLSVRDRLSPAASPRAAAPPTSPRFVDLSATDA